MTSPSPASTSTAIPTPGEPNNHIFVGTAAFVSGSRPDVEPHFAEYPLNYRAGWGFMVLTNMLPDLVRGRSAGGNGAFRLHAYAIDTEGLSTYLGSKAFNANNGASVKPFGTIDTPAQGGTASGSAYAVFGWALSPRGTIPTNGSTMSVFIDGTNVGRPVYNQNRADIASLFPGYAQLERRGWLLHPRHDPAGERASHHLLGRNRQSRQLRGYRQPLLQRAERLRRAHGGGFKLDPDGGFARHRDRADGGGGVRGDTGRLLAGRDQAAGRGRRRERVRLPRNDGRRQRCRDRDRTDRSEAGQPVRRARRFIRRLRRHRRPDAAAAGGLVAQHAAAAASSGSPARDSSATTSSSSSAPPKGAPRPASR